MSCYKLKGWDNSPCSTTVWVNVFVWNVRKARNTLRFPSVWQSVTAKTSVSRMMSNILAMVCASRKSESKILQANERHFTTEIHVNKWRKKCFLITYSIIFSSSTPAGAQLSLTERNCEISYNVRNPEKVRTNTVAYHFTPNNANTKKPKHTNDHYFVVGNGIRSCHQEPYKGNT